MITDESSFSKPHDHDNNYYWRIPPISRTSHNNHDYVEYKNGMYFRTYTFCLLMYLNLLNCIRIYFENLR